MRFKSWWGKTFRDSHPLEPISNQLVVGSFTEVWETQQKSQANQCSSSQIGICVQSCVQDLHLFLCLIIILTWSIDSCWVLLVPVYGFVIVELWMPITLLHQPYFGVFEYVIAPSWFPSVFSLSHPLWCGSFMFHSLFHLSKLLFSCLFSDNYFPLVLCSEFYWRSVPVP